MNDLKLTLADIASGLSRRASLPLRYSEDFVRAFFKTIEDGLMHDNLVKIKGFGTFKLVSVDARESINVNTGERFEIAQHTKVSFTPDAALRDAVNKPFLEFETVILNDSVDTAMMEKVDEVEDEEIPMAVVAEKVEQVEEPAPLPNVEPEQEPEPQVELEIEPEPVQEPEAEVASTDVEKVESTPEPEPKAEVKPEAEPTESLVATQEQTPTQPEAQSTTQPEAQSTAQNDVCSSKHSCRTQTLCYLLVAVLFMVIGYAIDYYWHPFALPEIKFEPKVEAPAEPAEPVNEPMTSTIKNNIPSEASNYPQVEDGEYWIVGVEGTEVMRPGKTLLNFSLKYYNSQDFVNYICVMNDITNPNIVPLDKELKMPKLQKKETKE